MIQASKGQMKAIERIIPKRHPRKVLLGAHVQDGIMTATDGKMMIRIHLHDDATGDDRSAGIIGAETLADGIRQTGAHAVAHVNVNGKAQITTGAASVVGESVFGQYPMAEKVVPTIEGRKPDFHVNANLLKTVVDALVDAGKGSSRDPVVGVYISTPKAPILFRGNIGPNSIPETLTDEEIAKGVDPIMGAPLVEAILMPVVITDLREGR